MEDSSSSGDYIFDLKHYFFLQEPFVVESGILSFRIIRVGYDSTVSRCRALWHE